MTSAEYAAPGLVTRTVSASTGWDRPTLTGGPTWGPAPASRGGSTAAPSAGTARRASPSRRGTPRRSSTQAPTDGNCTTRACPSLARAFLCAAMIASAPPGHPERAAGLYLRAAWACDDAGCGARASACRLQAVEALYIAEGLGSGYTQLSPHGDSAILVDLFRRSGHFDSAEGEIPPPPVGRRPAVLRRPHVLPGMPDRGRGPERATPAASSRSATWRRAPPSARPRTPSSSASSRTASRCVTA